jgi:hypothetical protein
MIICIYVYIYMLMLVFVLDLSSTYEQKASIILYCPFQTVNPSSHGSFKACEVRTEFLINGHLSSLIAFSSCISSSNPLTYFLQASIMFISQVSWNMQLLCFLLFLLKDRNLM